ncbi:MAG: hypothetical protein A3J93_03800 [Candidatus Magasanikbacteria bacterium RIFOXYC2_FULL_42_28]|uniref:Sortilin N-terminal domain-containing protein n=1 Tax=Candidatus Magasanikbacteria bacterium RIFOXYC2_FULL_42_28 TaxID=1798704 RepID=A0A1F6NUX4_9BACT|nr:MAG: hypothetical protein A3J93_03800 [Candidatus Magasanikbacteria bacterium RIFOXYC2_FULL_42_28]
MRKIFYLLPLVVLILTGAGCLSFGSSTAGPMGVFTSADKGETWAESNVYPTVKGVQSVAGARIFRLHTDPSDPNAIYMATRGQGLFYSYNNGGSWQTFSALAGKFIYGFTVAPQDKCVMYASDGQHIYKTDDCGRKWNLSYTEERPSEHVTALAVDYGNINIVYGTLIGGDFMLSEDGGRSWKVTARFGFETQYMVADQFRPKRVYVATQRNGLQRSDDGGRTFQDLSEGLDNFSDSSNFYRLALNPKTPGGLFWISKYGILESNDAGVTWSELKLLTPPGGVNIYAFAINPGNLNEIYYTGTILGQKNEHVRSTFYKTTDGGKSWVTKKLPTNSIPVSLLISPNNDKRLFLGFTSL